MVRDAYQTVKIERDGKGILAPKTVRLMPDDLVTECRQAKRAELRALTAASDIAKRCRIPPAIRTNDNNYWVQTRVGAKQ